MLEIIGVLFGCFGRKINGHGLPGGLIIHQGHLFALKGHLCLTWSGALSLEFGVLDLDLNSLFCRGWMEDHSKPQNQTTDSAPNHQTKKAEIEKMGDGPGGLVGQVRVGFCLQRRCGRLLRTNVYAISGRIFQLLKLIC